jgi:hypothetical protein
MVKHSVFALVVSTSAFASNLAVQNFPDYFPETPPPGYVKARSTPVIDWAQPPLGCVEEMVAHTENVPCLDLTGVKNPLGDWPADLPADQKAFWYSHRRGLSYCRARELMNREAASPGSASGGALELSWMVTESIKHYATKVAAIYEASDLTGVPPHVLTGAIYQESLFAELGIADDGGNYSCGMEQINLKGWCAWANQQPLLERKAMGWPAGIKDCNGDGILAMSLMKPFYDIAVSRLNGLPEYRLQAEHFKKIPQSAVVGAWPPAAPEIQTLRYKAIKSFIENCSDPRRGILAKAAELRSIYDTKVSNAFKGKERYSGNERFQRKCARVPKDDTYPLHSGWLMSVAAYNAGTRAVDAIAFYNAWTKDKFNDPEMVRHFTSDQIIDSIYWTGKYNPVTDRMDYTNIDGTFRSWTFYTACVAQRHIARVMQNVTLLPEYFVTSLDDSANPCKKSVFDENGKLVLSGVPPFRQVSPGRK